MNNKKKFLHTHSKHSTVMKWDHYPESLDTMHIIVVHLFMLYALCGLNLNYEGEKTLKSGDSGTLGKI